MGNCLTSSTKRNKNDQQQGLVVPSTLVPILQRLEVSASNDDADARTACHQIINLIVVHNYNANLAQAVIQHCLPLLLQCMECHDDDVQLQALGCDALYVLADTGVENREALVAYGAVTMLLKAVERYAFDVEIQRRACKALAFLFYDADMVRMNTPRLVRLLVQALTNHGTTDASAARAVCNAILHLLPSLDAATNGEGEASGDELAVLLQTARARILGSIEQFPYDAYLQQAACSALAKVYEFLVEALPAGEDDDPVSIIEPMIATLKRHHWNANVQCVLAAAVRQVVATALAKDIVMAGPSPSYSLKVAAAVVQSMQGHLGDFDIQWHGLNVLFLLLKVDHSIIETSHDEGEEEIVAPPSQQVALWMVQSGGNGIILRFLYRVLENYPWHAALQQLGCSVFSHAWIWWTHHCQTNCAEEEGMISPPVRDVEGASRVFGPRDEDQLSSSDGSATEKRKNDGVSTNLKLSLLLAQCLAHVLERHTRSTSEAESNTRVATALLTPFLLQYQAGQTLSVIRTRTSTPLTPSVELRGDQDSERDPEEFMFAPHLSGESDTSLSVSPSRSTVCEEDAENDKENRLPAAGRPRSTADWVDGLSQELRVGRPCSASQALERHGNSSSTNPSLQTSVVSERHMQRGTVNVEDGKTDGVRPGNSSFEAAQEDCKSEGSKEAAVATSRLCPSSASLTESTKTCSTTNSENAIDDNHGDDVEDVTAAVIETNHRGKSLQTREDEKQQYVFCDDSSLSSDEEDGIDFVLYYNDATAKRVSRKHEKELRLVEARAVAIVVVSRQESSDDDDDSWEEDAVALGCGVGIGRPSFRSRVSTKQKMRHADDFSASSLGPAWRRNDAAAETSVEVVDISASLPFRERDAEDC